MPPIPEMHTPRVATRRSPAVEWLVLGGFVALTLVVGAVGSAATSAGQDGWYENLAQPPLNPPSWVFGPVWTTLYILMALAAWRIWRQPGHRPPGPPSRARALALWWVQLALNPLWSVLFFTLHSPVAALGCLIVMALVLAAVTWDFYARDRLAGLLMLPTLLWVLFAGYLNAGIIVVN